MYLSDTVAMLVELKIENFGIIEELRLRPGRGLNVITGETGAGKTLLLTAIDCVLGARAGGGLVRTGSTRALVEALFDVSGVPAVRTLLESRGLSPQDSFVELKREIGADGRGRPYVNGTAVTLAFLRGLAQHLLEIHGQHEHQRILDPETHLDSLDLFAGTVALRDEAAELYHRYNQLKSRLRAVTLEADERDRRLDFLRFALEEIESFEPREKEFEDLQNEKALIQNSGRLFQDLCEAYGALREEDQSILDRLERVHALLERHLQLLPGMEDYLSAVRESIYGLESCSDFLREQKERLQFSPERLEDIEDRIVGYQRLHKKYGGTTTTVLHTRDRYLRELNSIEMSEEELDRLRSQLQLTVGELYAKAEELSRRRRAVIPGLEEQIASELAQLGMPGARIQVSVRREVDPDAGAAQAAGSESDNAEHMSAALAPEGARGQRYLINEKGLDRVEFLLSANSGESIQPLRRVASGGELSRITLALKTIFFAHRPTCTVVFDEVDAGVGGEVAHTIGNRLQRLSRQSQVVVVTHLHQIASLADQHFRIRKDQAGGRTISQVRRLQGDDRLQEMARMLGGDASGPVVFQHARELLAKNRAS